MKFIICISAIFLTSFLNAQNQNLSQGFVFDGEPFIAMNPDNSQNLVVVWMGFQLGNQIVMKTKFTEDGGSSWSGTNILPHVISGNTSADPSLRFDNNGNVYLCFIDYDPDFVNGGAIYVSKSSDGGASWGTPVEAISTLDCPDKFCIDRPWMVIDNTGGANDGNIYITSMNADQPISPPFNPYFVKSTDGALSFENPRLLDTLGWFSGNIIKQSMPTPTVASDGSFHAIYPSWVLTQNLFAQFIHATSDDAGNHFEYNSVIEGTGTNDSLSKKAPLLLSDPTDPLHLSFVFIYDDYGDLDVEFIESFDAGITWSSPIRVNSDPAQNGVIQDLVWADYDDDGDLVVCWRDRRNASGTGYSVETEIWASVKWQDSTNFSTDFPISDTQAEHALVIEGSGNDFMSVSFHDDTLYAVWGDVRTGILSIWFTKVSLADMVSSTQEIVNENFPEIILYPNPSVALIFLENMPDDFSYQILDANGKSVKRGIAQKKSPINIIELRGGSYFIEVKTALGLRYFEFIKN